MVTESFDFDRIVDRHHTDATKIEGMVEKFGRGDLLPFWIADMDFEAPPCILDALRSRLDQRVLGYTTVPEDFWQSIASWLGRRHGWNVDTGEITFLPGLKKGLSLCINFFSRPGDKVIIQPPVYHSFRSVIEGNGRRVAVNPLILGDDGSYSMDFDGLSELIRHEKPAMMLLCNPHNPVGQQWSASTLRRVASLCRQHGIVLVSDEIYGDMMLGGVRHIPTASVSEDAAEITVTLGAPSKTFNIPGIVSAWTVVKSARLREPFFNWLSASEFNAPPIAAMVATRAAYACGDAWLDQVLAYLLENAKFAKKYLEEHLGNVAVRVPDSTFALWLDFRRFGMNQSNLVKTLICRGHIALSDGVSFGDEGSGFMRMNIGTPRAVLSEGLERLAGAFSGASSDVHIAEPMPADIKFVKMHGLGNDFIYVDCMDRALDNLPELAVRMSRRHVGVGADGIIAILPSEAADCRMRIFNADGSEAGMCGNGIRCVARLLFERHVRRRELTVRTASGLRTVLVNTDGNGAFVSATVDMGAPVFEPSRVPVESDAPLVDAPLDIEGRVYRLTAVSMGNPHGVIFVDDLAAVPFVEHGPFLERHRMWPEGANIEFASIRHGTKVIDVRTWERGVGETLACGTGACAVAAAAVATRRLDYPVGIALRGGMLHIDVCADWHILMTGPAEIVFDGLMSLPAAE